MGMSSRCVYFLLYDCSACWPQSLDT